jgi:hypothetical protein
LTETERVEALRAAERFEKLVASLDTAERPGLRATV